MPDTPDAVTAGSSPAPESTLSVPSEPKEYAAWRQTGKLPDAKSETKTPKREAPATSKETSSVDETEHAPASETGEPKAGATPKRGTAETRLNEILADLKTAGLSPSELKTFKKQAQQENAAPATPSTRAAPEQTVKPAADPAQPVKPNSEDFKSWAEYEAAKDSYFEKLADFRANAAVAGDRARQQAEAAGKVMLAKLADAKARYGETAHAAIGEAALAFDGAKDIAPAVRAVIDDSPVMVDLLYTMGSKPAELQELLQLARENPGKALRKVVLIEQLVEAELAKASSAAAASAETAGRDESGKFTAPAKKTTQAPPPPREASGRGSAPADEVERAVNANDFAAFRAAANRRDIERRNGK